jgi:hypothetical protein
MPPGDSGSSSLCMESSSSPGSVPYRPAGLPQVSVVAKASLAFLIDARLGHVHSLIATNGSKRLGRHPILISSPIPGCWLVPNRPLGGHWPSAWRGGLGGEVEDLGVEPLDFWAFAPSQRCMPSLWALSYLLAAWTSRFRTATLGMTGIATAWNWGTQSTNRSDVAFDLRLENNTVAG